MHAPKQHLTLGPVFKKEKNNQSNTVEEQKRKAMDWQLGQEGTWLISPIIQTLSAPHIPLHLSLCFSPLFFSREQLFLQILTDINPRASDPKTEFAADPGLLVLCLLHLSLSSTISIPFNHRSLCSRSRSMHHNSTGLRCLMSELWISFQPFFVEPVNHTDNTMSHEHRRANHVYTHIHWHTNTGKIYYVHLVIKKILRQTDDVREKVGLRKPENGRRYVIRPIVLCSSTV